MDYVTHALVDADAADWTTVAAYFLAAGLCFRASRWAFLRREARARTFWVASAVALVLLGVNEPLDLQMLMTQVLKAHAQTHGWYESRRPLQYAFVVALAGLGVVGAFLTLWLVKRTVFSVKLAVVGFVSIGVFILFRASSFHRLDELLGTGYQAFNLGWFQELAGVLIVALASHLYVRGR